MRSGGRSRGHHDRAGQSGDGGCRRRARAHHLETLAASIGLPAARLCKPFATTIRRWRAACSVALRCRARRASTSRCRSRRRRSMRCRSAPVSPAPWAVLSSMSMRGAQPDDSVFAASTRLERRSLASKAARAPAMWAVSPSRLFFDFWRASTSPNTSQSPISEAVAMRLAGRAILFAAAVLLGVVAAHGGAVSPKPTGASGFFELIKCRLRRAGRPTSPAASWRTCCRANSGAPSLSRISAAPARTLAPNAPHVSAGWLHAALHQYLDGDQSGALSGSRPH